MRSEGKVLLLLLTTTQKKTDPNASQQSSRSTSSLASAQFSVGTGYEVSAKSLPKLHKAAAQGDHGKLESLLLKTDPNTVDKFSR